MALLRERGPLPSLGPLWDIPFIVEALLLLLAAPALYFPGLFPAWAVSGSFLLLALGWVWRRLSLGYFLQRTPMDWPLFFLFGVMVPVSLWASPPPLREELSIPRAYILVWNFCLFWTVAVHSRRRRELFHLAVVGLVVGSMAIAGVSLVSTQWPRKIPVLGDLIALLPSRLLSLPGAESGINANQVGGTLLYVAPLLFALVAHLLVRERSWLGGLLLALPTAALVLLLVATQSRASLLGLAVGTGLMAVLALPRGGTLLAGLAAVGFAGALLFPWERFQGLWDGSTPEVVSPVTGAISLAGRMEIWSRALYGIQDFAFTGMGLGTFRRIVHLLYPLFLIPPDKDIAHAHNFFLQTALDFGLPGLVAVLALYLIALVLLFRHRLRPGPLPRVWSIGILGSLVGQGIYSQVDAIAMGSKPNFLLWYLLALAVGLAGTERRREHGGTMEPQG